MQRNSVIPTMTLRIELFRWPRKRGILPIHVALAWVIQRPGVTAPIVGASKLEQLDQLIDGLSVTLEPDETHFLEEKYLPHPVLGY